MAQTRKRRRRKHRGTQGGRIDSGRRRGRPQSRSEAQSRARKKRPARGDRPPTWRGAILRGGAIAAIFIVFLIAIHRPVAGSIALGVFALAFYIPMGFYMDRFLWRRRQRTKMRDG
jgi:hypothetical protein